MQGEVRERAVSFTPPPLPPGYATYDYDETYSYEKYMSDKPARPPPPPTSQYRYYKYSYHGYDYDVNIDTDNYGYDECVAMCEDNPALRNDVSGSYSYGAPSYSYGDPCYQCKSACEWSYSTQEWDADCVAQCDCP